MRRILTASYMPNPCQLVRAEILITDLLESTAWKI